jgi:RNA polymerase sigma-70 factor, ECF subfamily
MAAIADLWLEHKDRLRNYIARRVRDRHVADDVLQDVFLKAHASLHTVTSPGSVSVWLFRVAANAIADHYRTHKPAEELPEDLSAPEQERDYVVELAACLQPMIAGLPDIYRVALTLSEIEGITQREVADRLGISVSGAKSRVQRGREKLRERLSQCCEIETGQNGIVGYEVRDKGCGCDGA